MAHECPCPEAGDDGATSCCSGPAEAVEDGLTFQVEGLDCAEEVAVLRRAVSPLVGGADRLAFDVLNGRMTVLSGVTVDPVQVQEAVARTGMSASVRTSGRSAPGGGDDRRRRAQVRYTAASAIFLLAGVALHVWRSGGLVAAVRLFWDQEGHHLPLSELLAYGLATVLGARFVVPRAWYAARRLRPDIHLLMTIAVAGALALGEWFEAATVTCLFSLSLSLESWSVGRARRAIAALLDLAPDTVRVKLDDDQERETAAAAVALGTRFVVRPGERIPLDGRVRSGSSAVDQAPITGESLPVAKGPDDDVFAGTINGDGALEVESTRLAGNTTLARIVQLVEQAHSQRGRSEQWVERFSQIYTPTMIALAAVLALVPPLALGGEWSDWIYRSLVLLVVSCPCALVISTPVSIVAAMASSARQGVLVKGGTFLEQPARLKALAFDKTGTLTRGQAEVVGVVPLDGHTEVELLERAAALEARSPHPLAQAIVAHTERRGLVPKPAAHVQVLAGRGVTGSFQGEPLWLGSHRYLAERGLEAEAAFRKAAAFEAQGQTVVLIGNDDHVCGLLAVADGVRPGAAQAVAQLRRAGVRHLAMLTGDNRPTAEAIARRVGVEEVHADLLPEDKVAVVEDLVARYGQVAMVGDGVNDAPAMARASLGIAMGAAGSDAAVETADVALMTDDLSKLSWLVNHSRRTLAVIRQNVLFSVGLKAGFVVLTVAGMATLWAAIAADMGASLLVVGNGLRLLRPR